MPARSWLCATTTSRLWRTTTAQWPSRSWRGPSATSLPTCQRRASDRSGRWACGASTVSTVHGDRAAPHCQCGQRLLVTAGPTSVLGTCTSAPFPPGPRMGPQKRGWRRGCYAGIAHQPAHHSHPALPAASCSQPVPWGLSCCHLTPMACPRPPPCCITLSTVGLTEEGHYVVTPGNGWVARGQPQDLWLWPFVTRNSSCSDRTSRSQGGWPCTSDKGPQSWSEAFLGDLEVRAWWIHDLALPACRTPKGTHMGRLCLPGVHLCLPTGTSHVLSPRRVPPQGAVSSAGVQPGKHPLS